MGNRPPQQRSNQSSHQRSQQSSQQSSQNKANLEDTILQNINVRQCEQLNVNDVEGPACGSCKINQTPLSNTDIQRARATANRILNQMAIFPENWPLFTPRFWKFECPILVSNTGQVDNINPNCHAVEIGAFQTTTVEEGLTLTEYFILKTAEPNFIRQEWLYLQGIDPKELTQETIDNMDWSSMEEEQVIEANLTDSRFVCHIMDVDLLSRIVNRLILKGYIAKPVDILPAHKHRITEYLASLV